MYLYILNTKKLFFCFFKLVYVYERQLYNYKNKPNSLCIQNKCFFATENHFDVIIAVEINNELNFLLSSFVRHGQGLLFSLKYKNQSYYYLNAMTVLLYAITI